jgi:Flp pilus assembly protein TadD/peroxiredoxin/ketosteroid isomerase-like protein
MSRYPQEGPTRRSVLKTMGLAPFFFRSAPFYGSSLASVFSDGLPAAAGAPAFDFRLDPHYPARSPLEGVLRLVAAGSDEYVTERYAVEIEAVLSQWAKTLKASPEDHSAVENCLEPSITGSSFASGEVRVLRSGAGIDCSQRQFTGKQVSGRQPFLEAWHAWLGRAAQVETAEFLMTAIEVIGNAPLGIRAAIRYSLVLQRNDGKREDRVGNWTMEWWQDPAGAWKVRRWQAHEETMGVASGPGFADVTTQALGAVESYQKQLLRGVDDWRTVLDGACGIDVYGNNGVATGDYDNDGFDDLYICQPSGLPNRLYRNRGDGTLEDVTEKAGVGLLDGTACALFADFENRGLQDLLVVCGSGPLLFRNQGDGTFKIRREAFRFAQAPQGTFTHAALADYDRDGRLDVYFCTYSYYLGLDQYHYPVPYFDARNGPANFLFHNQGDGTFVDKTTAAGLGVDNNRYSFACAWGYATDNGLPDLYVANDFGRANLYRNNGDGTFTVTSGDARVEDVGAGMSACWTDVNNDGRQDIYAANMWSAAGQRVAGQARFHANAPEAVRALYRRHARGNSLYRNEGEGKFENVSQQAGVEMGRWSWCSDFWDFDHDGYPDLYVANGYITAPRSSGVASEPQNDLGSFFWRQVVAKSPDDSTPSLAYEHGWNALNELIRSDGSWSGQERNVLFANNRDGTFTEVSGAVGLDFPEDGRSFALADLDHDGRLEVILKNRNAPQVRILHNGMKEIGSSIAFRLRGKKSNRDAIGAAVTMDAGGMRQTKYLQAGSGFLAQHTKQLFFGAGKPEGPVLVTVRWPSGLVEKFERVPLDHCIDIEEGAGTFSARPFAAPNPAWAQAGRAEPIAPLPAQIDTWLLEPLKAPEFSLPDVAGTARELRAFRGKYVLLNLWAMAAPACGEQLRLLLKHRASLAASEVEIVALNVDDSAHVAAARSFATREGLTFPVLFATQDVAGVYNIIYRYLFDRRRDLALPTSFLLDREGMIVKVYQGRIELARMLKDVRSMPVSAAERVRKALPWAGELYQGTFQRNEFTYGVAMFQHGYLEQAAESFEQVVAARPNDAEGYYNLGTLSLRRNDFDKARSYLQQTLKLRPNYPEAWNNLGMMAAQQGQPEEAVQNFQQALLLRPGYATALLNLGNLYRREKSYARAEEYLNEAQAIQPDDPEVQYSLGMLFAQQGQLQGAAEHLQKAVALRPDYPEALNNLGVLFVRSQDYAQAEEQFKTCIRIAPGFDQSYFNLARLYALRNDRQKARDVLEDLLRIQPGNVNARQALSVLE